ncbi:hypothetical protein C8J57DRAFT_1238799 [Mycena rebaudengoi]|nr:hypothetical protein C8J57DRAFT_1238799 [Mycena rebaudengoi]
MASSQNFMWRFISRQKTWTSLKNLTWETAFGREVRAALTEDTCDDHIAACLRLVSSLASTAMTALYALEQLDDHTDWNTQSSLTILVLGSGAEFDPAVVHMYEAIFHRIPSLTNLHVGMTLSPEKQLPVDCQERSASMVLEYVGEEYLDHVYSEGTAFQSPDLCVLMNGYIANNEPTRWSQTIQILLQRNIPSLFAHYTSYGRVYFVKANERLYAHLDVDLLRGSGASLVQSLTLSRNPWGSLSMQLNLDKLHGFCAANQWLVGAFAKKDDSR